MLDHFAIDNFQSTHLMENNCQFTSQFVSCYWRNRDMNCFLHFQYGRQSSRPIKKPLATFGDLHWVSVYTKCGINLCIGSSEEDF